MSLPEAARALLSLPPDRFVAERDALARALAERGDRSAAEVRRLRRPVGLAWVLNRLARDAGDEVEALLRAGDRLRAGHRRALAGAGPAELRSAESELREHARALRSVAARILDEAGRKADGAALSHLELLLRFLAPTPGPQREDFRAGALTAEPTSVPADVGGLAVVPVGARAAQPAGRGGGGAGKAPQGGARGGTQARKEKSEAARVEREARRAAADAARKRAAAEREVARAEADLRRAEAAAARADVAFEKAARRARELRAGAAEARAEVDRRRRAVGLANHSR
jgi:hypothetical protein